MKSFISSSLKIFKSYMLSVIIFSFFIYAFFVITKNSFYQWLPVYCFVNFVIMLYFVYSEIYAIGTKDSYNKEEGKQSVFRGLAIGVFGLLPIFVYELVYPFLSFDNPNMARGFHLFLNMILGPVYGFIGLLGETAFSYVLASLIVPALCFLGYYTGYKRINIFKEFRKIYKFFDDRFGV